MLNCRGWVYGFGYLTVQSSAFDKLTQGTESESISSRPTSNYRQQKTIAPGISEFPNLKQGIKYTYIGASASTTPYAVAVEGRGRDPVGLPCVLLLVYINSLLKRKQQAGWPWSQPS
jgi:hypothetical protein